MVILNRRLGKTGVPGEKPLGAENQQTQPKCESNPGHNGGRQVFSPRRQDRSYPGKNRFVALFVLGTRSTV